MKKLLSIIAATVTTITLALCALLPLMKLAYGSTNGWFDTFLPLNFAAMLLACGFTLGYYGFGGCNDDT